MSSFVISKCGHINAAGFSFGITPQSKISLHGNTLLTMAYRLQAETASAVFFRLISRYGLKIVYRKHKPLHNVAHFRCFFCKSRCCNIFGKSKMGSCAFLHRSARLFWQTDIFLYFFRQNYYNRNISFFRGRRTAPTYIKERTVFQ